MNIPPLKLLPHALAAGTALAALASLLTGCDDASQIGSSLVQDQTSIVVDSTTFRCRDAATATDAVIQSRTTTQLLGVIDAPQYGALSSEVVTQFMPAAYLDTAGVTAQDVDSIRMLLYMPNGAYVGDSIVPMGLSVHRLVRQLPSPIYSDFDPAGYYDPSPLTTMAYNVSALGLDSMFSSLDYRLIQVMLPVQLGRDLYQKYLDSPATFSSPASFAQFFPGLYIANSFGSGRVTSISQSLIQLFYHRTQTIKTDSTERDTVISKVGNYFAVTPEVVTNNDISLRVSQAIQQRVAAGEQILLGPTGMEVDFTFPGREIVDAYRRAGRDALTLVNSLTFSIPAEKIPNDRRIDPPAEVLMILSDRKDKFFANNSLTDDQTSFLATYSETAGAYVIPDMRSYLTWLLDKDAIAPEDVRFTVVPVTVNYETQSSSSYFDYYYSGGQASKIVSGIVPYVGKPAMARLSVDTGRITLTYSRQSAKQ